MFVAPFHSVPHKFRSRFPALQSSSSGSRAEAPALAAGMVPRGWGDTTTREASLPKPCNVLVVFNNN